VSQIWHVGIVVPDLEAGMAELGTLLQLTWRPVYEATTSQRDEHGDEHDVTVRVAFSDGGPFAVELMQRPSDRYGFDHLGYWTPSWSDEQTRLEDHGFTCFAHENLKSGRHALMTHASFGMVFEACDVTEDRPHLRDLLPPGTPFAGLPVDAHGGARRETERSATP
jgi:hypothetical protein